MATLYPSATTYPSSTTWPGTSDDVLVVPLRPELSVLVNFQDVSVAPTVWEDVTGRVRSFATSRGRDNELTEVSAGTATVTLENQDRFFEPGQSTPLFPSASTYPGIGVFPGAGSARPMNRVWIREQFAGHTETLFYGYADSWDYSWPAPGFSDALATVSATDEMKVLALDQLPILAWADKTNYQEVVEASFPVGYWRLRDLAATRVQTPVVGENMIVSGTNANVASPVVGDGGYGMSLANGAQAKHTEVQAGDSFDLSGSQEFGIEFWFRFANGGVGASRTLIQPPLAGAGFNSWAVKFTASNQIQVIASDASLRTVTSGALAENTWYYIAVTTFSGMIRLFVNAVEVSTDTWAGPLIAGVDTANDSFAIGPVASSETYSFAELALYRRAFDRAQDHYTDAIARGFPQQNVKARINAVLEASSSRAPRLLETGVRDIVPTFMHGQAPLDEIRDAVNAENDTAMFFVGAARKGGTLLDSPGPVIFLDAAHRFRSPWNTIQATFSDTFAVKPDEFLPYLDLETDYTESFLYNDLNVTRDGGITQNTYDATSVARYYKRPLSISGLKVLVDSDAYNIAVALLGKYKDPMQRVTAILLDTSDIAVAATVFELDLGDKVRVVWSTGGIDQTLFIQKIDVEGANDGRPWRIRLGVSPN